MKILRYTYNKKEIDAPWGLLPYYIYIFFFFYGKKNLVKQEHDIKWKEIMKYFYQKNYL